MDASSGWDKSFVDRSDAVAVALVLAAKYRNRDREHTNSVTCRVKGSPCEVYSSEVHARRVRK